MGYDVPDDDSEHGRVEGDTADSEYEKTKAKWREIEEEARKAAGQAEEESEGQGDLPEPDAEGRKMAESEEVRRCSFFVLFTVAWCLSEDIAMCLFTIASFRYGLVTCTRIERWLGRTCEPDFLLYKDELVLGGMTFAGSSTVTL